MRRNKINPILARLQGICFNDPNDAGSGADPGGGGGAGDGGGAPSPAIPSNGGGQEQEAANHNFNAPPSSAPSAERVSGILAKKDTDVLDFSDIAALIGFDAPFAQSATPAATPAAAPAPTTPAPVTPPVAQPTPTAPQPLTAEAIAAAVREAVAPQNPNPNPTPTGPKNYYEGERAIAVNNDLVGALIGSTDAGQIAQAAPAVNALVNGLANHVMRDMQMQMFQVAQAIVKGVPQQVTAHATVNEAEKAFYGKYSELNKPAFKAVVDNIAGVVIAAKRKANPNFRLDAATIQLIGEQAHKQLKNEFGFDIPRAVAQVRQAPKPQAQPGTPAPQQRQPGQREPFVGNGSSRPPVDATASQSADLRSLVL